MTSTIFLSYARSDLEPVQQIAEALEAAGLRVFLDVDSLQPGDRWQDVLERGIREADFLVTIISHASVESEWVKHETEIALSRQAQVGGQTIVPVRLDDVPPEALSPFLRQIQWVDFTQSFDKGMEQLLAALGVEPGGRAGADDVRPTGASLQDILDDDYLRALVQQKVGDLAGDIISGMAGDAIRGELDALPGLNQGPVIEVDPELVFVVSAYSPDMEYAFEAISAACEPLGLRAQRVKDIVGDYKITDKIEQLIRGARYIVCDLTHERPNVYFELGYARGIGKTVITIARKHTEVHFDVKDWTYLPYEDSRPLERALRSHLEKLIEQDAG